MRELANPTKSRPYVLNPRLTISSAWRAIRLALTGLILLAGTARSSPITPANATPAIPIKIINTNAGRVMTTRAERYEDKIYITGLVYRPSSPGIGAHVIVWGVDMNNQIVFSKTADVLITGKPSFIHTESYVVSVSPSVFGKAKIIFVTFHSQSDAGSTHEN
jgi:hypothetical protein